MGFHIYHVIQSLGVGGGQTMLFELHEAFSRYHKDVTQSIHLLNQRSTNKEFVKSYGISYEIISEQKLAKRVIKDKDDCVTLYHKLMTSSTDFLRPIYGRSPVIVVNHTHTDNVSYNRIRNADRIIAVCNNMRSNLSRIRVPIKVDVVHNGVNGDKFDNISPLERNIKDVLLTGRINALNTIKYSEDWIRWCQDVDLPKQLVHEYMGGGAFLERAKKECRNKQAKNVVKMIGAESLFKRKVSRLKSWDLFLYEINRDEGLSISVLESLACGVPVVCSNHYGNKEIIEDGVNGFVYRNRDELENILTELCLQPELLESMRESTLKHFKEKLDAKITAQKYRKVIDRVIKNFDKVQMTESARSEAAGVRGRKRVAPPPKVRKENRDKKKIKIGESQQKSNRVRTERVKKMEKKEEPKVAAKPKDENDKFTILTSSYNNAHWLEPWSESILRQSYRPLEVVFVDDCNKDKTRQIIREIGPKFAQKKIDFKYIRNSTRLHCSSSYQQGFNEATGFFMGVLDSDDMLTPDAVEYIMNLYKKYPKIGWIYTQFQICKRNMTPRRNGFCMAPDKYHTLLDLGKRGKHAYSHWRTFSHRVPKLSKIWKPGLDCAVDKYMGYRLEELSPGMFADHICYKYREGVKHSISTMGKSKEVWKDIVREAEKRRKKNKTTPHRIATHKG